MTTPAAKALLSAEGRWEEALTRQDQAGEYARSLQDWTTIAIKAIIKAKEDKGERTDSWSNVLTGIGTTRDKATYTKFLEDCQLSYEVREALYHNDDMAARIADAVPEEMFREGYELHDEDDSDASDDVEGALEELGTDEHFESGFVWARVHGAHGILVGVDDGQKDEMPIDESRIRKVYGLTELERHSLFPVKWYDEPKAPKFGEPELYQILIPGGFGPMGLQSMQVGATVHESRLILFPGARTSLRRKRANFGWDDSIFQRVYQVLMKFGLDWASATHMLSDSSQGVLKLKGLLEALASNNKAEIAKRGEIFDLYLSNLRTVLLDADEGEEYSRVETSFTGVPDMLDRTSQRLAAAARMPVSVLMGTSQKGGLNGDGDTDIRKWYDQIASLQRRQVTPRLKRLIKLVTLAKEGPTGGKEWEGDICFNPLWQLDPLQEATRRKTIAEKDAIEIEASVTTAEEVATSRYGKRGYSIDTTIALDVRKALMAEDADKEGDEKDPMAALNGAQVASLLDILKSVATEELPRESAVETILASFPVTRPQAEKILGKIGKSFFVEPPPPPTPGGFGKPPAAKPPTGKAPSGQLPKPPPGR